MRLVFAVFAVIILYACSSPAALMRLSSPDFADGAMIPERCTCDGSGVIPQLIISDVPSNAKSLALVMDDPDAPMGTWDHWVVWGVSPHVLQIKGQPQGITGRNSWGKTGYGGPCPPSGTHRYFFRLYALDTMLGLAEGSTKQQLIAAMKGHILAEATLMGRYQRKGREQ
jgi:hypothetical protein